LVEGAHSGERLYLNGSSMSRSDCATRSSVARRLGSAP
jgi:hypothetical protein